MPKPRASGSSNTIPAASPEEAKALYDMFGTLAEVHRELIRRETPVHMLTLSRWRKNGWTRGHLRTKSAALPGQARKAAAKVGLPAETVRDLEAKLSDMDDATLIVYVTRHLLINSAILMAHAKQSAPQLVEKDAHGLAALSVASLRMVEGAHDLMRETLNLAERAMKEKCGLLVETSKRDGAPPPERIRPLRPIPFSGLIEKFGGIINAAAEPTAAVEVIPPNTHKGTDSVN